MFAHGVAQHPFLHLSRSGRKTRLSVISQWHLALAS